jgi:Ca2+-binding RTX toxin-like protein
MAGRTIIGTDNDQFILGTFAGESIFARGGDDIVQARAGNDRVFGEAGFDTLFGDGGNDRMFGGTQNDNVNGGEGDDILHGDGGLGTLKGSDFGSDNLKGGRGRDILYQSDGNDTLTGGADADMFYFKWQDPMINLAVGTGRAFATLTDFDARQDKLVFDVAGLGRDAAGANFIDGGNGIPGGKAASFFKGAAAMSNGESVMVLTDQGFATGADAVVAAKGEAMGDFVMYFNTTVNVASLLFVDATDVAHSIARFSNIDSLADLQAAPLDAGDYLFV